MKKTLLFLTLSTISISYGQSFNCNNVTKKEMQRIYSENKSLYYVNFNNKDVMQYLIESSVDLYAQACINSWSEYEKFGIDYMYNRFTNEYGHISKNYYKANTSYLETLRTFNRMSKKMR